jgi:hypothetical protein
VATSGGVPSIPNTTGVPSGFATGWT